MKDYTLERLVFDMMVLLTVMGFILGVVAGTRVIKLFVKAINSMFDRIEEKI